MEWREITGYKYRYRISDQGEVQRFYPEHGWMPIASKMTWNRLHVTLRRTDGTQTKIAVVNLMDQCFFGGYARKNGFHISHKNGSKTDCAADNLFFTNQSEIGKRWGTVGPRKAVVMTYKGEETVYQSMIEAAQKNGLTKSALGRRINGEVYDQKGRVFKYA